MTLIMPSPEMQILIRRELNEDVNTRDASLQAIKEWLAKQPHLPDTWDEVRLLSFLRGTNFSLERCKKKLDLYFTMRAAVPEFFANRDIKRPELQEISTIAFGPPLPQLTPEGRRVIAISGKTKNELKTPMPQDAFKLLLMIGDIRLGEEEFGVSGDVYILDASALSARHVAKASFSIVQKFLKCVEEAYPVKLKEIHIVNAHPLIDIVIRWVKPLLKNKIVNRIHVHSHGLESLHKFVPKDILPEELGGTGGKLEVLQDAWMKKMEDYTEWYKKQENIKADESKRPGKPFNFDELFGVDGSFKQLTID